MRVRQHAQNHLTERGRHAPENLLICTRAPDAPDLPENLVICTRAPHAPDQHAAITLLHALKSVRAGLCCAMLCPRLCASESLQGLDVCVSRTMSLSISISMGSIYMSVYLGVDVFILCPALQETQDYAHRCTVWAISLLSLCTLLHSGFLISSRMMPMTTSSVTRAPAAIRSFAFLPTFPCRGRGKGR